MKNQRDNSPKEFLAKSLHFSEAQKNAYFELAKNHNENANKIREQIKIDKENLFQLLKTDQIVDSVKNNAALKVSLSIQSLDILTFDHFKKVRALCTEEQKPKFGDSATLPSEGKWYFISPGSSADNLKLQYC